MVLAISAPSMADDLNPPDWAGAPGTIYGIWNFDEESPSGDTEDPAIRDDYPEEGAMVPHDTHPEPEEMTQTSDTKGAHKYMIESWTEGWSWLEMYEGRDGVITADVGWEFFMNNFEGNGTKLIRLQITWWPSEEADFVQWYWSWNDEDDEEGPEDPTDYLVSEIEDVGDGWRHSTYEIEIPLNPYNEGIWVGTWGNNTAIDQVVIDTICYPGAEPPVGPGRIGAPKPPVTVDSSDMPVHEPQDPDGPPAQGPTQGQLFVDLTWQPSAIHDGEPNYIDFTATVVIDPNEIGPNDDFIFVGAAPDGTITLTFDEDGWSTPQPVNVQAVEDLDREGDQRYPIELTVTIDIADPNFGNPTPVIVESSVVVVDNDIPYISVLPPGAFDDVLTENDPCVPVCVDVSLSHLPTDDVYVLVTRWSDVDILLESMSVMDPPLDFGDPNRLTFTVSGNPTWNSTTMTSNWNVAQQICLEARDDDELVEPWWDWIEGEIVFTPYSEDERYRVSWLTAEGTDPPEDPCDPGVLLPSGGEAEETTVDFNVQDNECGAVGYDPVDYNEDCRVGLADFAHYLAQWLICTDPYDDAGDCIKLWELE